MCVIFDLDGTLADTGPGIMESVRYATEKYGYPELSEELLRSFVGPPLGDSFMRCCGCDREEAEKLTAAYREHYRAGAMLHAEPYEGIFDLLGELCRRGHRTAVATGKPQAFAERVLKHFGFEKYLTEIHGADFEGRLTKADIIRMCIRDGESAVMVGDTEQDARGAAEAGVPFIGVRYGYGNLKEMEKYPCIGMADTAKEILPLLEKQRQ